MARISIIDGHPSADPDRYVHAVAKAYQKGAEELNEVKLVTIAELDFPFIRETRLWMEEEPEEDIAKAQQSIAWADHVVFVYPLWMGDVPALLKAFIEQVARPGFAIEMREGGAWRSLLQGKSARIIVTMGMPAPVYRLFFRAHSVKSFKRNILKFMGFGPVRTTIIGNVEKSNEHRQKWLKRVEQLGRLAR